MVTQEQIVEVFRRFDAKGTGVITNERLCKVLRQIDPARWDDTMIAALLEKSGLSQKVGEDKAIRYEDLISWAMNGPVDSSRPPAAEADPVCQAAFDGELEALRGLLKAGDGQSVGRAGYVQVGDVVAGLWTLGVHGFNTFEMRSLASEPNLPPASPLQYAAFAGKADVMRFLIEECGACKEAEGALGASAADIGKCHCVRLDGEAVVADAQVLELLEDEAPLSQDRLARTVTRSLQRPSASG
uniref:EF-hand domain-containing protein n=1 Tax=Alexandrium catenella TaxID=2925 RepID=A0A7S1S462_ALECA|mmetsp:Transcript_85395/g.226734  ORF Transcript_85395/g.226734 Transcript_85395/m.226734 type:complete len:243 (+) Transcript_85395:46-774(+)|eukprot:CAMPEP_0171191200 /NCGR_PEP_ID=MMETSP0790-20130122/19243_1 /TAXON_ID=2925 /ORGANISM="Alexandrium catenella, Strain OF101" /LENGTH=242 /DNA_ID=CAMNT_0011656343 /DNA_START=45 /DNA_END=773 /DNA_ORIENTATION=+